MAKVTTLEQYRIYLEAVDEEAQQTSQDEYADLLSPGEVIDLLVIRDEISREDLSPEEQQELERLDDLLIKHYRLVTGNIPPEPRKPRSQWWWHLHAGPQVRQKALALRGKEVP